MVDAPFGGPLQNDAIQNAGTDILPSSMGNSIGNAFLQGIDQAPVNEFADFVRHRAEAWSPSARMLSADEANDRYGMDGLKFDRPIADTVAADLHDAHHIQTVRQAVIDGGEGGAPGSVGRWAAGSLPQFIDPLSTASFYVPGMGAARIGAALGDTAAGAAWRGAGSAFEQSWSGKAAQGVISATAGSAAAAVPEYYLSRDEHNDQTMAEMLTNIAFGGLLGGGFHLTGARLSGWRPGDPIPDLNAPPTLDEMANPVADRVEAGGPDVADAMLRDAIASHVERTPNEAGQIADAIDPRSAEPTEEPPPSIQDGWAGQQDPAGEFDNTPISEPVTVGHVPEGIPGVEPLPIRLEEGFHTGPHKGMGRAHIAAEHGAELHAAGYPDVISAVKDIAKGTNEIRRNEDGQLFVIKRMPNTLNRKSHGTLITSLRPHPDGHYTVITSGRFKGAYLNKRELLWQAEHPAATPPSGPGASSGDPPQEASGSADLSSARGQSNLNILSDAARRNKIEESPEITASRRAAAKTVQDAPTIAETEAGKQLSEAQADLARIREQLGDDAKHSPELAGLDKNDAEIESMARAVQAAATCMIGKMTNG